MQDLRDVLVGRGCASCEGSIDVLGFFQIAAEKDPELASNEEVLKAKEVLEEVSV